MKVLVTGASGFLGSHTAERLQHAGHELRLLMRKTSSTEHLTDVHYERVEGDVADAASLRRAVEGMDAVVHIAGLMSAKTYEEYEAINARATGELLYAAKDAGVQRFVYASSLAAGGPSPNGHVQPIEPSLPISPYGKTKLAGEFLVRAERLRLNTSVVRLPVIYGPRDRGLLPFFIMANLGFLTVYGNGENKLSWIHVYDAADALATVLERSERPGSVFTVCDGPPHTWTELATGVGDAFGKNLKVIKVQGGLAAGVASVANLVSGISKSRLPLTSEKVQEMSHRYWVCDNAEIEQQLGWRPDVPYREGIRDTLAWYREHDWLKLSNL